jgi:hypothetical protein
MNAINAVISTGQGLVRTAMRVPAQIGQKANSMVAGKFAVVDNVQLLATPRFFLRRVFHTSFLLLWGVLVIGAAVGLIGFPCVSIGGPVAKNISQSLSAYRLQVLERSNCGHF